jgi:hypothetical protein
MSSNFRKLVFSLSSFSVSCVSCNLSWIRKWLATNNTWPVFTFFYFIKNYRCAISHSCLFWITMIPSVLTMLTIIEECTYAKSYAAVYHSVCSYCSFMESYSSFRLFTWEFFSAYHYLSAGTAYMLPLNHNAACAAILTSTNTKITAAADGLVIRLGRSASCKNTILWTFVVEISRIYSWPHYIIWLQPILYNLAGPNYVQLGFVHSLISSVLATWMFNTLYQTHG